MRCPVLVGITGNGNRGRRRRPGAPLVTAQLEHQRGTVGAGKVDLQSVLDLDGGHPTTVDEHTVEAPVVDRDPAPLVKTQYQMVTGD